MNDENVGGGGAAAGGVSGVAMVELSRLEAHPANSNTMPVEAYAKLKAHLEQSDRYPPLIVRALPPAPDAETGEGVAHPVERYQLLDGHHRAKALRELGKTAARCDVWDVNEDEALVLLATLNRLRGRDDPRKRAALLDELGRRFESKALLTRLPETPEKLKRFEEMHGAGPRLRAPQRLADMPVAVHFFLKPKEKRTVDVALRSAMSAGVATREAVLLGWAKAAKAEKSANVARKGGDG